MSDFIVSARKYRPADFASVVGQGHITSTLKNAISRGQLAHAYLFCGPRGVGKTTCARIFAKAINCQNPVGDEACGECESCRAMAEGRSFNIHELDAASNNSVEDIRSLTEQVRVPPQVGRYSVYIIDEVHMLSAAAFNAFLKTLEEPPAHAIFILATTEKHKIIPTILSRCQIYDFNRIRVEDAVGYLRHIAGREGVAVDDESLHLIALKADGGMRDALSMFDKAVSFCGSDLKFKEVAHTLNVLDYDTYFNIAGLLLGGDYREALMAFDGVVRAGFSPQSFAAGLNAHFRDLLVSKNPQTLPLLEVSGTLLERFRKQGAEFPMEFLFDAIAVLTALDAGLRTATNPRLNVELGLMKLAGLGQKKNSLSEGGATDGRSALPELTPSSGKSAAAGVSASSGDGRQQSEPAHPDIPSVGARQVSSSDHAVRESGLVSGESGLVSGESGLVAERSGSAAGKPGGETTAPQAEPAYAETHGNLPQTAAAPQSQPAPPSKPDPSRVVGRKSILAGNSIGDIMNGASSVHDAPAAPAEDGPAPDPVDPAAETKINNSRERFLNELSRSRPRIAMALEDMAVAGNAVSVGVPSEQLREEILRNRTEILSLLSDISRVAGRVEMVVEVRDDGGARKPVKAEDKLKFLTDRNPALSSLRKELNLEIE